MKNSRASKDGILRRKDHMVDPDVDGNTILNLNLEDKSVGLI
jgi:hypothetical protein